MKIQIIETLLSKVGYVKKEKAVRIGVNYISQYVEQIQEYAKEDFGVNKSPIAKKETIRQYKEYINMYL